MIHLPCVPREGDEQLGKDWAIVLFHVPFNAFQGLWQTRPTLPSAGTWRFCTCKPSFQLQLLPSGLAMPPRNAHWAHAQGRLEVADN